MNACLPQASYPYGNFSETYILKPEKPAGSWGHFRNFRQTSISPPTEKLHATIRISWLCSVFGTSNDRITFGLTSVPFIHSILIKRNVEELLSNIVDRMSEKTSSRLPLRRGDVLKVFLVKCNTAKFSFNKSLKAAPQRVYFDLRTN